MRDLDGIIIGAGIGGLAAGVALRRRGIRVGIFERADRLDEIGAGLSLWRNAIDALAELGLAAPLRAIGLPQAGGGLRSWRGHVLAAVPANSGDPLVTVVPRAELHALLLGANGPDRVRLGAACVGVEQDAAGVTARFADGREVRGHVLIGADGLHSVVRAQLFGAAPPRYAGYTAWRGVTVFEHRRLPAAAGAETWGRGARFGLAPMSHDRVYWYATRNAPEGETDDGHPKADLLRLFRGWHPPIEAVLEATDEDAILRNDIYDREPLPRWTRGRVTLLGDAAHPMTPNLGQGACQAIEDAVVLARSLDETADVSAALTAYEGRRLARTARIVRQSWRFGRIAQWQNPVACWARDTLVRLVPASTQLRRLQWIVEHRA